MADKDGIKLEAQPEEEEEDVTQLLVIIPGHDVRGNLKNVSCIQLPSQEKCQCRMWKNPSPNRNLQLIHLQQWMELNYNQPLIMLPSPHLLTQVTGLVEGPVQDLSPATLG